MSELWSCRGRWTSAIATKSIRRTNRKSANASRAARHVVYREVIAPFGPVPREARFEGSRVLVSSRDVDQSLVAYGAYRPISFQLCGAQPSSCRFVEATLAGDHVVLEVPQGLKPARVRCCWADNPVCTLYGGSGCRPARSSLRCSDPGSVRREA